MDHLSGSALRVSINGEWRVTISTDQGDPRGALRMLEEIGARKVKLFGPAMVSHLRPAMSLRLLVFQPKEEVEKGVRFLR